MGVSCLVSRLFLHFFWDGSFESAPILAVVTVLCLWMSVFSGNDEGSSLDWEGFTGCNLHLTYSIRNRLLYHPYGHRSRKWSIILESRFWWRSMRDVNLVACIAITDLGSGKDGAGIEGECVWGVRCCAPALQYDYSAL
jgi:hypothetical protein